MFFTNDITILQHSIYFLLRELRGLRELPEQLRGSRELRNPSRGLGIAAIVELTDIAGIMCNRLCDLEELQELLNSQT